MAINAEEAVLLIADAIAPLEYRMCILYMLLSFEIIHGLTRCLGSDHLDSTLVMEGLKCFSVCIMRFFLFDRS